MSSFDSTLVAMGAKRIGERDEATLTENQRHGVETEQGDLKAAIERVNIKLNKFTSAQLAAIAEFQQIALLEDQPMPEFGELLFNALIDQALSAAIGQFAKALATAPGSPVRLPVSAGPVSLPTPPKQPVAEGGVESAFNVGLDSLKAAIVQKLGPASKTKIDSRKEALAYFASAMREAASTREAAYRGNLVELDKRSALTEPQLHNMEHTIESTIATIAAAQKGCSRFRVTVSAA